MTDTERTHEPLATLERYYDTVPRATCDVEDHGPLTLFVARQGFPYYARPRLGLPPQVTVGADAVTAVLERQRELGVPQALEWVHETTPSLLAAARAAGMSVEECPLLALEGEPRTPTVAADVRTVPADDPALPLVRAAIDVGFGSPGTAVGTASTAERDARAAAVGPAVEALRAAITGGRSALVGAFDPGAGPVGGGSHNPRDDVSEIVGVAVLPAFRRRGLAAAITAALARDAQARGVSTVFCSAENDAVAHVYEGVGFRRVGTACIAEAP